MAKFKYKFKSIKEIKERIEKKVQKELAVIDLDIANKRAEIKKLQELKLKHKKKKIESQYAKLNDLHFYEKYEAYLNEQIEVLNQEIDKRNIERKNKLEELVEKSKETKTFEKLEEKHFESFRIAQEKQDQLEMDEIAVKEFVKD